MYTYKYINIQIHNFDTYAKGIYCFCYVTSTFPFVRTTETLRL